MKRRLSLLLTLVLCIASVFGGSSKVLAGTMGAIPVVISDTARVFEFDVDGYISAGSTYLLPNPFDEEENEQFFVIHGDMYTTVETYVDPSIETRQVITLTVQIYSKSGTYIKTYSGKNDNNNSMNAVSVLIPPQGPDRKARVTISCANSTKVMGYGLYDWPRDVWEG